MNRISFKTTALLAFLLALASSFTCPAQSLPLIITNATEAKAEGAALVQEILAQRPETNMMIRGILKIRGAGNNNPTNIPIRLKVSVHQTNWLSAYYATINGHSDQITVFHNEKSSKIRFYRCSDPEGLVCIHGANLPWSFETPFAGSDFWVGDLALEFFQWPEQRLIKKEIRRSRSCRVLESINPQPATNDYARVVSWIDRETLGLIHAEAFDANDKLLKEFGPKEFKKVNGQWQLQEMEIRNVQTGSRTRIEFNLGQ